jgi:hypothetical protein
MARPNEWPDDWRKWISVPVLAELEDTTPRQVYFVIDSGMAHSRHGDRIRVRRCDWHEWHLANMVNREVASK